MPLLFAEVFKDEINANNEEKLYNGIKRIVRKFSEDADELRAINEFTRVISGGASLNEIMQVAIDEARHPTLATGLTVDSRCELSSEDQQ